MSCGDFLFDRFVNFFTTRGRGCGGGRRITFTYTRLAQTIIMIKHDQNGKQQAVEALGQQPVADENADAVMGAHSNGEIINCYGSPLQW